MSPAEECVLVDTATERRFSHCGAFNKGLRIDRPALPVPKIGQRCAREDIEGLVADTTAIAWQPMRIAPMRMGGVIAVSGHLEKPGYGKIGLLISAKSLDVR